MKYLKSLFLLLVTLLSCSEPTLKFDLDRVEVFYIPFGIDFPTSIGDKSIVAVESYFINDYSTIKQLEQFIGELKKSESGYKSEDIYLRCKLFGIDGSLHVLDYNST